MKKQSKKKIVATLFFIALLIGMFPDVQSDPGDDDKPSPDYGVYNAMEEIQDEKTSRINSPEILNETQGRFDNLTIISGEERVDLTSRRDIVTPYIPVPEMLGIYDTMLEWDAFSNNQIVDWILPPPLGHGTPLNYYIYTRYINTTNITERWTNASLRPTVGINLGGVQPNLDRWWNVDVDNDGTDDIQVFLDPVTEAGFLSDFSIPDLINLVRKWYEDQTINIGVTVYYNIRKINDAPFNTADFKNLEVYIAKSMSYSDKNFILFMGLNLTNLVTELNCSVTVNAVQFAGVEFVEVLQDIINQILAGQKPTINMSYADLVNLSGPYIIQWDSNNEVLSSLGFDFATAKIEFHEDDTYEFLNRSWVDADIKKRSPYNTVPTFAELWVDADDDLSSFNEIRWTATHICDAHIRFFDSQENVTYAEIEIGSLPKEVDMFMTVEEKNGMNITTIDYEATSAVNYLSVHHYEFFDTSYENIAVGKIASGEIEYIHLFMNISHIPRKLYLKGVFNLEEVEDTPTIDPGLDFVGQLLDTLVHRVISQFTRIANTLSSIPYRLLSMAEEGGFALVHTYYDDTHDEIDEIEFLLTSGDYAATTGNYFSFYNNTRPSQYPTAQISLSGRISKVIYINASFEEDAFAEIRMMNNQRFRAIYADDINSLNAEVNISNVPGTIYVYKTADHILYDGGGTSIDELRFLSEYQGSYMDFRISDMADLIHAEYEDNRTYISTSTTQDKIGDIEFLVTTGPIYRMNGNHLLLRQEANYSLLSGRIKDVSRVEYLSGENGKIEIYFAQENCMNISLFDNRSEKISADLIIDPMPSFVFVNLSGILSTGGENFTLPQLESTGVLGLVHIIFGIATLGNEIMAIIDEATQNALSNIGDIITDLSLSYRTTTHITLIGKILRGETFTLGDVDWMHGISARQQVNAEGTSMAAKLYLSGLPTEGIISARVQGDDIFLDFHLNDYAPKHDWLSIDVRGLQDRDVMLYLNDIQEGIDLDLRINLSAKLNTIPQSAIGSIHMDSNKGIGSLYGRMRQTIPEISISEIFLSSVPRNLDTEFNLSGNISLDFQANSGIEYMFVKTTRRRNEEFHDIYAILHELPKELEVSVIPVTNYDMDGSLLQELPSLDISSSGNSLDAYIFADGKGMGQVGIVELQVVNAPMTLSGKFSGDKYSVKSTGVDYLWIHVMELPIMEGHNTKSIEIVGKDIESFDIKVDTLFGNYPIIGIENAKGGEVQLVIDHEMDGSRAGIALIDFKTRNGLPSSPSILINGGSVDLEKGTSHTIIPMPILTLWLTILS